MLTRALRICGILSLFLATLPAQAHPEMGRMWTFENLPTEYLAATYGFTPEQPWLDHARLSSLKFGQGCSSSFVSPKGLILTNHHCARSFVARVSPPGQDYLADGFFARSLAEEVPVPDLQVRQVVAMKDVTSAIMDGTSALPTDAERVSRMRANQDQVLAAARTEHPGLVSEVVSLYQGGMYQVYTYKVWRDIRLCVSPHLQSAKFGGDPDNFTYPRFSLDFALLRAYEDGVPANTSAHYLRVKAEGPSENEPVFVVGSPGSTGRLNTIAQMERLRDATYPLRLEQLNLDIARLNGEITAEPQKAVEHRANILRLENGRKAFQGYLDGLRNDSVMDRKRAAEAALRKAISQDAKLKKSFGDAFERMEAIAADLKRVELIRACYQTFGDDQLDAGLYLARVNDEETSLRDQESAREALSKLRFAGGNDEQLRMAIERCVGYLRSEDPLLKMLLDGRSPAEAVAAIRKQSRVKNAETVERLAVAGQDVFEKERDIVARLGRLRNRALKDAAVLVRARTAEEAAVARLIGQAFFAVYGTTIPPDATGTLRISDGRVAGFPSNGTIAPWFTSLYGLYARHTEFGGKPPFDLPKAWDDARGQLNLRTRFNLVSTCDIIGGNSGSPMIDREGRLVGLVFDGNIESLANRFVFTDEVARTVCVHPEIILVALRDVFRCDALVAEMFGR
ncbi:MAG TPA: S46 family peptidase [Planctomycetota bacterium]|nr:S46 family peptidase [Planctomycetota bacterium]